MWRRFQKWFLWSSELFNGVVPYVSIDRLDWAMAVWIYGWYTHEWGSLTNFDKNCEVWRKFELWCLWGSVIAVKGRCPFVSIERLDWAMAVWIYGWYTHEWGSLTNCEKTVRCDVNFRCDFCELCDSCQTLLSFLLYQPFELSYGCLIIWAIYTLVR